MSQVISVPRLNQILARTLGFAGVEAPAEDLSPEISPVLVVESDRPEWKFLSSERYCGADIGTSNGAGPSYTRLANPSGSGVLCIIEKIVATTTTVGGSAITVRMNRGANRANAGTGVNRDTRFTMGAAACIPSQSTAPGSGTATEAPTVLANSPYCVASCPIILGPGGFVDVGVDGAGATAIEVSYQWRERPIEAYENT